MTDPAIAALVEQAVADALAAQSTAVVPLDAVNPLASATPNLGLTLPGDDDPALISDLNNNFSILDGSVTATQAITLTNKTLTAPVINNPTINDWTNAAHTHLNPAGAGTLDAASIVSGTLGTGPLLRQAYLTGGSFTGVVLPQPTLVNPVARDSLLFGPAGTGATDVAVVRTASPSPLGLALNGSQIITQALGDARYLPIGGDAGGGAGSVALTDPLIRDTISFGAKPSGAADATLRRLGAGSLRSDANFGFGGYLDVAQIATQAAPAALTTRLYAKTDGNLYIFPAGGAERPVGSPGGVTIGAEGLTPIAGCDPEFRQSGTERYELVFQASANGYGSVNLTVPQGFTGGNVTFRLWTWSATAQTVTWRLGGITIGDGGNPDAAWAAIQDQSVTYVANQMTHSDHVWASAPASAAGIPGVFYVQCMAPGAPTRLRAISVRFGS